MQSLTDVIIHESESTVCGGPWTGDCANKSGGKQTDMKSEFMIGHVSLCVPEMLTIALFRSKKVVSIQGQSFKWQISQALLHQIFHGLQFSLCQFDSQSHQRKFLVVMGVQPGKSLFLQSTRIWLGAFMAVEPMLNCQKS